jgi:hypothetical protein
VAGDLTMTIIIIGIAQNGGGLDKTRFSSFRGNESQPGKVSTVASRIARQ